MKTTTLFAQRYTSSHGKEMTFVVETELRGSLNTGGQV